MAVPRYNPTRMRNGLQLALGVAFTVAVAGCSLLVSFDDIPDSGLTPLSSSSSGGNSSGDDDESSSSSSSGSTTSSSSSSSSSSSTSSSSSSGGVDAGGFPPACDNTHLADINCSGNTGPVCGSHVTGTGVTISADDLITCAGDGTTATCVQHCSMGCVDMSGSSFVSQCANCVDGQTDRWYCGKNTDWNPTDNDVAYHCSGGRFVTTGGSPAACGTDLCHTSCTRTSPPPLNGSCCEGVPDN